MNGKEREVMNILIVKYLNKCLKKHALLFHTGLKRQLFQGNGAETEKEKEEYAMKVHGNDTCSFFPILSHWGTNHHILYEEVKLVNPLKTLYRNCVEERSPYRRERVSNRHRH